MSFTRQRFLKTVLGAGAAFTGGCLGTRNAPPMRPARSAGRLRVALIGVGGQGLVNLRAVTDAADVAEPVALCDVDETVLLAARDRVTPQTSKVRLYKDFRVLFDAERSLDAVFLSTPDHGHALQAAWALAAGCDLYIEPPAARTLGEVARMRMLARQQGALVQIGLRTATGEAFCRALEILDTGILGAVTVLHAWTNRPVWPQGNPRPEGSDIVPVGFDWDLWLGGAPTRPYISRVYHPFNWRGWHDFGTGTLGDAGSDLLHLPFRALALQAPVTIESETAVPQTGESFPRASRLRFTFAARRRQPPVTLHWYDGGERPDAARLEPVTAAFGRLPDAGCLLIGSRGLWFTSGDPTPRHFLALTGETSVREMTRHPACRDVPQCLPRTASPQREFLDALRNGTPTLSDLEHTSALTACILTGCVAQRIPGRLTWQARRNRFVNHVAANSLVAPVYREPWGEPENQIEERRTR
ncbi:MAG TPA: Gfo/Idh/MocA family oxidoreductase [Kiritimatiellia bacterium]|nr:Gfo/Idh/MocA family oxidoreductase [Kiritimatiellia bacterium]HOM59613.1 Gfo/Idh/MocA family oxidoreductase [Kiritimatiellia bacterium]HOR97251.1 Gfo/Idh/MocA family oxidoreductase [Kiritimatiellia bacterium]HPK37978.1 Gfo/Idh/MocA family oxidoreductase [Kiritimatiellia bacterium]